MFSGSFSLDTALWHFGIIVRYALKIIKIGTGRNAESIEAGICVLEGDSAFLLFVNVRRRSFRMAMTESMVFHGSGLP